MSQVNENQVIPSSTKKQHPFYAPPRDLNLKVEESPETAVSAPPSPFDSTVGIADFEVSDGSFSGDSYEEQTTVPQTPAIIGVKRQIISMQPDGSALIDLVLEVQDIPGVTEYDIRVAKEGGTL